MEKRRQVYIKGSLNIYKIKVTENGPYSISGGIPLAAQTIVFDSEGQCLEWSETKRYPGQDKYSLCRCGKSQNLPFCDGTHKKVNFIGKETANQNSYLDQCQKYSGPALDLTDAKIFCAHAGFCDRAGGTWDLVSRSDDPHARQIAIEEVCNCPSGRLMLWDKSGQAIEPTLQPSIVLMVSPDGEFAGPIWVRGGIPIESGRGNLYEIRNRITLCGCGRSSNKPFCDGSHRELK